MGQHATQQPLPALNLVDELIHENVVRTFGRLTIGLEQAPENLRLRDLAEHILAIASAPDFETALAVTLEHICQATGWQYGEVWLPHDQERKNQALSPESVLISSPVWYAPDSQYWQRFRQITERKQFLLGRGLPGRVWKTQQPEWIPHIHLIDRNWFRRAALAEQLGIRSGLGVPIVADKSVLAVLAFFILDNRQEDEELVALVSTLATQIGIFVQRKRAEAALQTSQASLQSLFDSLPGIVFRAGPAPKWTMEYLSQGCYDLTGYTSDELLNSETSLDYSGITHPEDLPKVLEAITQASWHQEPYVVEYRIRTRSGAERWVWEKGYCQLNPMGEVTGLEGFITDITDRKHTEEVLRTTEAQYRSIFENAVEGIFQSTPEGKYRTVNPMLAQLYGYDSPEALISQMANIGEQLYVNPEARTTFIKLVEQQGTVRGFEAQIRRSDGEIIWISECARVIRNESGEILGYEGTVQDITDRKRAEAELHRRDNLLQGLAEATNCLLTNPDFDAAIPEALQILGEVAQADRVYIYQNHPQGCSPGDCAFKDCSIPDASQNIPLSNTAQVHGLQSHYAQHYFPQDHCLPGLLSHPYSQTPTHQMALTMRFEWVRSGVQPKMDLYQSNTYQAIGMQDWYPVLAQDESIRGQRQDFLPTQQQHLCESGTQAILLVPIFVDEALWGCIGFDDCQGEQVWSASEESILETIAASIGGALKRLKSEQAIEYQAFHDALTGLPNRMLFNHRLPVALAHAHRNHEHLAVVFLDLDRFKTINDRLGHAVGDQLLQQATSRLLTAIRKEDTIARWGGDEFTLCLPHLKSTEDAAKISQRILTALRPAFHIEGHELYVTASIGLALFPQDGDDLQTLLINADAALYRVKEQGRNHYQFYQPEMNAQTSQLLTLEQDLHHALDREEFQVYYQPRVDARTGKILQMEALLRWNHPTQGLICPHIFIPLAEDNGLMVAIGEWVLYSACTQVRQWQQMGLTDLHIAVNLSPRQFQSAALLTSIRQILDLTQLDPTHLELEITETTVMKDVEFAETILCELKNRGVRLALDDFGTGYSSLIYLKQFPLHTLKVDQTFVQGLPEDAQDMAIVSTVVALGQGLGLQVVAEGVESLEQLECLRALGCTEIQGHLFSPALSAQSATTLLQETGGYLHLSPELTDRAKYPTHRVKF